MQIVSYSYDAFNHLVGRDLDTNGDGQVDQRRRLVYDGDKILAQFDGTGSSLSAADLSHAYLWSAAVDELVADDRLTDGVVWPMADQLGTARDVATYDAGTDTTSIADHRVYDSFGNLESETSALDYLFGYTGQIVDDATDLQNHHNRWYDPATGRWLSEDPISINGGDANLYRYVGNAAMTATDPTGLYEAFTTKVFIGHSTFALQGARRAAEANGGRSTNSDSARIGGIACGSVSAGASINELLERREGYPIAAGLPALPSGVWRPPQEVPVLWQAALRAQKDAEDDVTPFAGYLRPSKLPESAWPPRVTEGMGGQAFLTNITAKYRLVMNSFVAAVLEDAVNNLVRNQSKGAKEWRVSFEFERVGGLTPENFWADVFGEPFAGTLKNAGKVKLFPGRGVEFEVQWTSRWETHVIVRPNAGNSVTRLSTPYQLPRPFYTTQ